MPFGLGILIEKGIKHMLTAIDVDEKTATKAGKTVKWIYRGGMLLSGIGALDALAETAVESLAETAAESVLETATETALETATESVLETATETALEDTVGESIFGDFIGEGIEDIDLDELDVSSSSLVDLDNDDLNDDVFDSPFADFEQWSQDLLSSKKSFPDLFTVLNDNAKFTNDLERRDAFFKVFDQYNAGYYNNPSRKLRISSLQYNVGTQLGSCMRHSEVSFKGIEKLLKAVSFNCENIAIKVAESIPPTAIISVGGKKIVSENVLFKAFADVLKVFRAS